jgi:acyl-CoA thioester hydrolase
VFESLFLERLMFSDFAEIEIPFHDVDVMQIAWHGHYYKYFEIARTKLMQSLGCDWPVLRELGIAMPVVESAASYRSPLLYGQKVLVKAVIHEFQYPELIIEYQIQDKISQKVHASGRTRQVYHQVNSGITLLSVPEAVLKLFATALGEKK